MSTRLQPGDCVTIKTPWANNPPDHGPVDGIIALELTGIGQMPCIYDCGDPECKEWANVLAENGIWHTHVPECHMELSEFGQGLRDDVERERRAISEYRLQATGPDETT